ncbi:MAG: RdgB/HAM1 family non-canonical purine NTP pyrophosphatase [bacterium]|nr:RdgB/HAM1 family non-canonical purine NTP pyrophosphatase [bacterium]
MELLFGTQNQHKVAEAAAIMSSSEFLLKGLQDFPSFSNLDVEETGTSFEENALLKAKTYAELAGIPTIADDSGLEVSALDNQPGVYSKRFIPGSDTDRNEKILSLLNDKHDRSARFVSVICLYLPKTRKEHFFRGEVAGTIASAIKGTEGFGYDPIFIPDGYEMTFGELGGSVKNTLSHRARSLHKLAAFLEDKGNNV